ncbi:MAG TPA: hypothetical protein VH234_02160 [Candidatus Saccharimonadales bacterium]|jgi:hypothetical protein|nr:hypothetical protein [Candidatus Saccharimonadales bacterium]
MKRFSKIFTITAGVMTLGLLLANLVGSAPIVSADGTGQIEGGAAVYQVKNLTESGAYGDNVSAKACEELQYGIRLHNSGFVAVNNINVKVDLPSSASTSNTSTMTATYTDGIVPSTTDTTAVAFANAQSISFTDDSTTLFDGNGNAVKTFTGHDIIGNGLSLGSLNGSTTEYLTFQAKVNCPTPPPAPVYTCDELNLTAGDNRTVKLTVFNTTAKNGATFKDAVIDWGDSSSQLTTANVVGQTHQYTKDGTYTVAATAHFTVNGQDVTASGPSCEKVVTFSSTTPPTVTPPASTPPTQTPPTTLVNTGPGSVAAIFAAATVAGTVAYRRLLARRLS